MGWDFHRDFPEKYSTPIFDGKTKTSYLDEPYNNETKPFLFPCKLVTNLPSSEWWCNAILQKAEPQDIICTLQSEAKDNILQRYFVHFLKPSIISSCHLNAISLFNFLVQWFWEFFLVYRPTEADTKDVFDILNRTRNKFPVFLRDVYSTNHFEFVVHNFLLVFNILLFGVSESLSTRIQQRCMVMIILSGRHQICFWDVHKNLESPSLVLVWQHQLRNWAESGSGDFSSTFVWRRLIHRDIAPQDYLCPPHRHQCLLGSLTPEFIFWKLTLLFQKIYE